MSSVSVHPPGNKVVTSSQMWHNAIFRFKRGLQVSSYKQVSENEERFFFFPHWMVRIKTSTFQLSEYAVQAYSAETHSAAVQGRFAAKQQRHRVASTSLLAVPECVRTLASGLVSASLPLVNRSAIGSTLVRPPADGARQAPLSAGCTRPRWAGGPGPGSEI